MHGVQNDLRKLEDALSTVKAVLLDAEEKQEKSHAVKNWIKRLKEVVYDADDLIDDIATEALRRKIKGGGRMKRQVCDFFSSSNHVLFHLKIGHRIKDIRERLDGVASDISKFNFIKEKVVVDMGVRNKWRETDSYVLESEMVGREKDKETIIESLLTPINSKNISTVAIVGFGGLGKTTLAQIVYNDERVGKNFEMKMWVCVSEESNIEMLVKKILEIATSDKVSEIYLEQLQNRLRKELEGKKYLLVFDDVWNVNNQIWSQLRKYLMGGAIGSKILVTTRDERVALDMDANSTYLLKSLTDEQSWSLFEKVAFTEGQDMPNKNLINIGKAIAKKCKGVPLAIKTLGSLLRLKANEIEWLSILENEMWRMCDSVGNIFPVLKLSYDHLPNYLRQCFAYCAMFPKDYKFKKEILIHLWMAQGYLISPIENEHLEDIGEQYFNELSCRSFFQKCGYYYQMHDLIHDLAQLVAGGSCFTINNNVDKVSEIVHHVYYESYLPPPQDMMGLLKAKGMKTLLIQKIPKGSERSLDMIFSSFTGLRALVLPCDELDIEFLNPIGKLKHLRYLDLKQYWNCRTPKLPNFVSALYNLHTLMLGRDRKNSVSLRYHIFLDIVERMPVGLGKLTSLHILSYFTMGRCNSRANCRLNELNGLNQLRGSIRIEGLGNVRNVELESMDINLKEKKHLQSLRLYWDREENGNSLNNDSESCELLLDKLQPHPNLKELFVQKGYGGVRFSNWLSSMKNLVELKITDCPKCRFLPPLEELHSLGSLFIDNFNSLEYISVDNDESSALSSVPTTVFPSLQKLYLDSCPNLRGWSRRWRENEMPQFPCLSELAISECPNLIWMPTFPSLETGLWLWKSSIRPLVQTMKMMTPLSSEITPSISSSHCSVTAPLSKLKGLDLHDIKDLESIPNEWLQQLTALEDLYISECEELNLCNGDDGMQWQCLKSLQSLSIWGIPKLMSLPEGIQHITTLRKLSIADCNLVANKPDWIGSLTSLQELDI